MTMGKRIAFIGGGNMASAIIGGLLLGLPLAEDLSNVFVIGFVGFQLLANILHSK